MNDPFGSTHANATGAARSDIDSASVWAPTTPRTDETTSGQAAGGQTSARRMFVPATVLLPRMSRSSVVAGRRSSSERL